MSQTWTVTKNEISRTEWDRYLSRVPAAMQQDWAYGEAMMRTGARVWRLTVQDPAGEVCALAQFVLRPFAVVATFALCTYGPVWVNPVGEGEKQLGLRALRREMKLNWPRLVAFTPDEDLRPLGFSRIMTGDATVRIDLTQDEASLRAALDGKWRNRLVAAEKSGLVFTSAAARPGQYQWLLDEELKQRRTKGYRGLPADLTGAWQTAKASARGADKRAGVLVWRADLGREAAGAMLFLTHGAMATYFIGWSSEDGRRAGAHNLILWNAMLALKERGVQTLDLGGVNTGSGAGIARFKLGAGGAVIRRTGVWV
jgi:hypothetical protein